MEWIQKSFTWVPTWTNQPDLSTIRSIAFQNLYAEDATESHFQVAFFAEGGFNKLYRIECSKGTYLMRIAMPIYPSRKTRSEVATILWLQRNTKIPVPTIIAYRPDSENHLGFEWILMEMMPGRTLCSAWRTISLEDKECIVKSLAHYQTDLLQKAKFGKIGNIYIADDCEINHTDRFHNLSLDDFEIGPMVSTAFYWIDRERPDIERGPFSTSNAWINTRLELLLADLGQQLEEGEADEDDVEDIETMISVGQHVKEAFKELSCPLSLALEIPTLWHDDLSMKNILINENNEVTGIVDWESVSVLPSWYTRQFPRFLEGRERKREPIKRANMNEAKGDAEGNECVPGSLGESSLYWEHMLEYERTILRSVYLHEMEQLNPGFIQDRQRCLIPLGFEYAVLQGDSVFTAPKIRSWLEDVRKGNIWDLRQPESNEVF